VVGVGQIGNPGLLPGRGRSGLPTAGADSRSRDVEHLPGLAASDIERLDKINQITATLSTPETPGAVGLPVIEPW